MQVVAQTIGSKLIIIDPLMAFLGGGIDSHKDQGIRQVLTPLAELAESTGAAVLLIRHLDKGAGRQAL